MEITSNQSLVTDQEEQTMEMKKTYIPYDILVRILSQLPANALIRLRWACKYWLDLITRDPEFEKMHLHHSLLSSCYPSVLISSFSTTDTNIKEFLQCRITDTTKDYYTLDQVKILTPFFSLQYFQSLGTCHGLLLFRCSVYHRLYIFNPCTKEYKLLPCPPPLPISAYSRNSVFGFGYDSSMDDYIVIRNSFFYEYGVGSTLTYVQVYRLGTNTWTTITIERKYPYNIPLVGASQITHMYNNNEVGVFMNGALYWMGSSYIDDNYKKIISFDIGKKTYQVLSEQPECCHGNVPNLQRMRLQLFEGSLCLVNILHRYYVEMWVMKDHDINNKNNNNNKESSWTKLFKIAHPHDGLLVIKPLRLTNNGEILSLKNSEDFVSFNPKKSEVRTLNLTLPDGDKFVEEVIYTESIASLKSGTYMGQE